MRINLTISDKEYELLEKGAVSSGRTVPGEIRHRIFTNVGTSTPVVNKRNPYIGYSIITNPEGRNEPWYSDDDHCKIIWILNPKPPFNKVKITENDEWYNEFTS